MFFIRMNWISFLRQWTYPYNTRRAKPVIQFLFAISSLFVLAPFFHRLFAPRRKSSKISFLPHFLGAQSNLVPSLIIGVSPYWLGLLNGALQTKNMIMHMLKNLFPKRKFEEKRNTHVIIKTQPFHSIDFKKKHIWFNQMWNMVYNWKVIPSIGVSYDVDGNILLW